MAQFEIYVHPLLFHEPPPSPPSRNSQFDTMWLPIAGFPATTTDNVPSPTRFFRRLSLLRHDVFPSFPWPATPSSLLYLPVNIALNSEAIHKTYIRDDMDDDGDGPLLCGWSPLHVGTYSYTASATSSLLFWWGTIHPSIQYCTSTPARPPIDAQVRNISVY